MGDEGAETRRSGFHSAGTKLAADCRPKGLGENRSVEFLGFRLRSRRAKRQGGRMREVARGGKRFRASILQCVSGAPVSGGGNALRMAVAG